MMAAIKLVMGVAWKVRYRLGILRFRYLHGVKFGAGTTISPAATFMDYGMVEIGTNCSISGVLFVTHSGGDRIYGLPSTSRPIRVGNDTMIGAGVTIGPGVTIGDRCVIGFDCTIRKNVPNDTVMVSPEAIPVCSTDDYLAAKRRHAEAQA